MNMQNNWNDRDATALIEELGKSGVNEDLALRVYTTRLLGRVPQLVLHGGGNTSVKTTATDIGGQNWDVLCVKGSGWDMGVIEPAGLPAVKLEPLLRTRNFDALSDEMMVELQRSNLIYSGSPNPSVEALLHAFIPHKFVDHTHSTAVLAVIDQENSAELAQQVFGPRFGFVPYIMPGFDLAKKAAEVYEANPDVDGLILDKHGIFTFAQTAKGAYDLMIDAVSAAEDYVATHQKFTSFPKADLPAQIATPENVLPIVRGIVAEALGEGEFNRFICDYRTDAHIRDFVDAADLADFATRGMPTPDLSIRIKNKPVILPVPEAGKLDDFKQRAQAAVDAFIADYTAYFTEHDSADDVARTMLDPMPRLALIPGFGLIGFGRTGKDAAIAADVGEIFIETVANAERHGAFHPVSMGELFKLEYWSLEQAKLASAKKRPLDGQIVLVTGGAGAIGAATCAVFAEQGAQVVVADLDLSKAQEVAQSLSGNHLALACDVTDPQSVASAFDAISRRYGGLDIVVSNAGAAWEGAIGDLDDAILRKSFELNFFSHQTVSQHAIAVFKAQGTGGCLLYNTSKQAINPGANFGAYGLAKAATLFLSRQYALEYGAIGVRSNAVNADRIRSGLLDGDMIANRSSARGVSVADYMAGNLLRQEVTARDVAEAFLAQALARRTTGNVATVDGGNIAAILR
ncbi:bifunctional aldolase/short-chain dehydrogenase [Oceaniglobus ichthyenteri]|uniref:bifunctional aldolase/short-chain dehydrogenase n=1 Tax=Oceaniglobus ichthyenteri TaxID=2136177 RepID=UPI001F0C640B|nr:bifunctional aldolase/short-chain dehydrogenase [Oceaniglobus ichthyenteri]